MGDHAEVREDCLHLAEHRKLRSVQNPCPCDVISSLEYDRATAYIRRYIAMCKAGHHLCSFDNLVVHVGDEPRDRGKGEGWVTWSAVSNRLPTIRRSSGLYLSAGLSRQVLLRELYVAHGFPALAQLCPPGVPQYQVFFRPFATYAHSRQALGNSQHVAQIGNPWV